jgi:hypothetical protein
MFYQRHILKKLHCQRMSFHLGKNNQIMMLAVTTRSTPVNKELICHAETPSTAVRAVYVEVEQQTQGALHLKYELSGDLAQIRIPAPQAPAAVDGLWEHTCFEVFVAVDGEANYHEFNFSPSGQWAAYAFSDYRVGSVWTVSQAPAISVAQANGYLLLEAVIADADLPQSLAGKTLQLGLTAVIEANDGSRSYWALHHPVLRPDFHDRAGFILLLNPV